MILKNNSIYKKITYIIFPVFFLIGIITYKDYGISVDEEFEQLSVSYTTGGVTLTAAQTDASGLGNSAGTTGERWKLGASFAF